MEVPEHGVRLRVGTSGSGGTRTRDVRRRLIYSQLRLPLRDAPVNPARRQGHSTRAWHRFGVPGRHSAARRRLVGSSLLTCPGRLGVLRLISLSPVARFKGGHLPLLSCHSGRSRFGHAAYIRRVNLQGRGDSNSRCRFWRPVPLPLGDAPMCSCGRIRATKKPTVCREGLRWARRVRGISPLHEAHLPAAKDARVLGGPLAVRRLLRSIERAVPGISRQRSFDAVHGQHGGFLRSVAPGWKRAFQNTHRARRVKPCVW